jgi:hypothetical protein
MFGSLSIVLAMGVPSSAVAFAEAGAHLRTTGAESIAESGYARAPSPGTHAGLFTSPSGCAQQADHLHRSHHNRERVNAEIRAFCSAKVPLMEHTAQLWHTRFWGWQKIGKSGSYSGVATKIGSAAANDWCHAGTFRVTGDGNIVDVDGRTYYAFTESEPVKDPCSQ